MIRRRLLVLTLAGLLAVAVAPAPALAKGLDIRSLTVAGPGMDKPVTHRSDGGDRLFMLAQTVGLFRTLDLGGGGRPPAATPPDVDLGPAYTLTWTVADARGHGTFTIQQVAYPHASRGGWVSTKAGQALGAGERSRGGWTGNYYSTVLRVALVPFGVPAVSPVPVKPWTPPPPATVPPDPSGGWVPPTTLVVALLACAGLVVLASRRRAAPTH